MHVFHGGPFYNENNFELNITISHNLKIVWTKFGCFLLSYNYTEIVEALVLQPETEGDLFVLKNASFLLDLCVCL